MCLVSCRGCRQSCSILSHNLVKVEHSMSLANASKLRHIVCYNFDALGLQTTTESCQQPGCYGLSSRKSAGQLPFALV